MQLYSIADVPSGGYLFISMPFSAKFGQIIDWHPTLFDFGAPVWEILDPLPVSYSTYYPL